MSRDERWYAGTNNLHSLLVLSIIPSMNKLKHFQKYQFWYEAAAIFLYLLINTTINATSVIMEAKRQANSPTFNTWEPFVWEYSSALSILLIFPAIIWLLKKFPLDWSNLRHQLKIYVFASIVFSGTHVLLMVTMRKIIYWLQSMSYQFGDIPFELLYEYRKDLWAFIVIIIMIKSYGFILSRIQGEASLIADGEESVKPQNCDRLLVKKLGKEFIIKVTDIEWLESSGNYVNLHIKGRIYPVRATLSRLIEQISDKGFCRIHRSHGVNLDVIDSITPLGSGDSELKLANGKVLNLSRRYKDGLKVRLV